MPYILSKKKSTYGSPYAFYSCHTSMASRTPTTAKLVVTAEGYLQYSSSYLGTGAGYGLIAGIQIAGVWYTWILKDNSTKWSGTTNHSKATTITVPAAMNATSLPANFRVLRSNPDYTPAALAATVCSGVVITSVSDTYANVSMEGVARSQAEATVSLSGLPSAVGYERIICWYKDGVLVDTTAITGNSAVTSYDKTFVSLSPSAAYKVKAEVRHGSITGTLLTTQSVSVSTPGETGTLHLVPKATFIIAEIKDMFDTPNYSRGIEGYYKKAESSEYILAFAQNECQGTGQNLTFTGLASNETYDIRILIKSGETTLLTLEGSVSTLMDVSLVPTAIIESITQKLGTRECTVIWRTDKAVAGTKYELQSKAAGDTHWTSLETFDEVVSPCVVTATAGNIETQFRIASWNYDVVDDSTNYSDRYSFYVRDDFVWDIEKTKGGQFVITAYEWNRLAEYAEARTGIKILPVRKGEAITAEIYNTMKNTIDLVTETGIVDKCRGDAISAADIDALRVAINDV